MLRKVIVFLTALLMFAATADVSADDYDWEKVYDFHCKRLVNCVDTDGTWDHSVYYFAEGNNRCLVVVCHGFHDNGGYGIVMHKQYRRDYAKAVEESLAYWLRQGKLVNAGPYDYVFMNTCYSGYASQDNWLQTFGVNLHMAIDYKGVTGMVEQFGANGEVVGLSLWKGYPRSLDKSGRGSNPRPPGLRIL